MTIHDTIQIGNRAYYANSRLLRTKLISRNTKIKTYKTLVRSVVTYGGVTRTLIKMEQERQKVCKKAHKTCLWFGKENDECRIKSSQEIDDLLNMRTL